MNYECPTCKSKECWSHCNHCGVEIKWLNYLGDPHYETNKQGNKVRLPYLNDDTVHRCMKDGTKDGKFYRKNEINEYVLDEYRTITRYGGPVFICNVCNRREDLPVMLTHHKDSRFDCEAKLMAKFFKEKPKRYIDPNTYSLDDY